MKIRFTAALAATIIAVLLPHQAEARHYKKHRVRTDTMNISVVERYLPHPPGCPRTAFCACGAAVEIFGGNGRDHRKLWSASAWFQFRSAEPAPGRVAVRQHHVFVLKEHIDGYVWMAIDYNSGGHLSRVHPQSIRGYRIVAAN